ncbi:hypothetical protein PAAG_12484 [Paracoccidioides lutzii Pb01]|uniref:Uncharacterized protein n=1 Tax=Paracoccidioides lutzii (strain ATCC MYA-826 / Pb01) TaxID=502779 RepID=A0A0A2UZ53_PARBA|nr:hypothetical protein PAAG_12484 [Paracoccidioides lutzii Pb01]KGQ00856.1 hypothetical protein PAAG_12484 [Paracoccidioides lutzii Pb01]
MLDSLFGVSLEWEGRSARYITKPNPEKEMSETPYAAGSLAERESVTSKFQLSGSSYSNQGEKKQLVGMIFLELRELPTNPFVVPFVTGGRGMLEEMGNVGMTVQAAGWLVGDPNLHDTSD